MRTLLVLILVLNSRACEFRIAKDRLFDNIDASIAHFSGSYALSATFDELNCKWFVSDALAIMCGFCWEIKDGLYPYERYGYLGGDGFSKNDMICNISGVITHRVLSAIIKKIK